jgi:ubiquinone/menaquinone biosynthesis C-methylase UbiE
MVNQTNISRVNRSKEEAKYFYDRISGYYDWIGGLFERKVAIKALKYLQIQNGEKILEIGFGTGYCLQRIATLVGQNGKAFGIDISQGMIQKTKERLGKTSLLNRVDLYLGDAGKLPFKDKSFDKVFISFTLELFDTPEIPEILREISRVLKPDGKLGIVGLSKTKGNSMAVKVYEWAHNKWPKYIDCRPIYITETIQETGFKIIRSNYSRLVIMPVEIIVATKELKSSS